ncbi:MAG: hypothetical protein F6K42_18300 [Leptolyngbya sp. SIO1D8]|nr:hypothetical protein [Leptolyngbya sp. SIO1D8]
MFHFSPHSINHIRWWAGIVGAISFQLGGLTAIAQAQSEELNEEPPNRSAALMNLLIEIPSQYEIGLEYLRDQDSSWPIVTQNDTSLYTPTLPSLWWNRDQVYGPWGGYRLIRSWISFRSMASDAQMIDIQVDPQYWDRLDYTERYAILNQLGTTGMSYGYHVRLYRSIDLVGLHACDFNNFPALVDNPNAEVPVPELDGVYCSAAIGPFVVFDPILLDEDLFAPP